MPRMSSDPRPIVVAARRTPIGTAGGALASLTVEELAGPVLAALTAQAPSGAVIDDVYLGNCMGPGGNVARVSALSAGLDISIPAMTVDRQCASGLAAISTGADRVIASGATVLAGGVESASTAPWRMWPPNEGETPVRYERAPFAPRGWSDPDMGAAADALAAAHGISRARQDEYAARSHERAVAAAATGAFASELIGVGGLLRDERPREGFTVDRLARFPSAFGENGTVTAANSCGINDGSAAVLMTPSASRGLRILATASAGVDPSLPGLGLVPASQKVLAAAGLGWDDVDVIEFNEAFAGQILACADALGIDDARICPQGGALALGHPWGASGAVLMVRLFARLVEQQAGRIGLAAIAAGGGQGVAVLVERVGA